VLIQLIIDAENNRNRKSSNVFRGNLKQKDRGRGLERPPVRKVYRQATINSFVEKKSKL